MCDKVGRTFLQVALVTILLLVMGCSVGPKYVRPPVQSPPGYKELPQAVASGSDVFRTAQPRDGTTRGKWWEAFNDQQLNELEEKSSSSNQGIASAAANFLAARALVREARSQYFPTVSANPSIVNSRPSPGQFGGLATGSASGSGLTVKSFTDYSLPFDASWEPDFWGRIRNTVKANIYAAQASAADLENVRLSVQAELAVDYYELRAQDSLKMLFDSTVVAYQDTLDLTGSQYKAGLGSDEAVAQAEAQLRAAQAQDTEIGVAKTAYYPTILLSASGGFGTSSVANWLTWPSRFWSVGTNVAETVFDAGLRKATVQQYRATYDQTVANYEQTVLTAFQQVEDNLASLRILSQDIAQQDAAVEAATRSLQEATVRYKAGLDPYLNVIAAQTVLLNDQQTATTFRMGQMVAAVGLMKALGGGWNSSEIPSAKEVEIKTANTTSGVTAR